MFLRAWFLFFPLFRQSFGLVINATTPYDPNVLDPEMLAFPDLEHSHEENSKNKHLEKRVDPWRPLYVQIEPDGSQEAMNDADILTIRYVIRNAFSLLNAALWYRDRDTWYSIVSGDYYEETGDTAFHDIYVRILRRMRNVFNDAGDLLPEGPSDADSFAYYWGGDRGHHSGLTFVRARSAPDDDPHAVASTQAQFITLYPRFFELDIGLEHAPQSAAVGTMPALAVEANSQTWNMVRQLAIFASGYQIRRVRALIALGRATGGRISNRLERQQHNPHGGLIDLAFDDFQPPLNTPALDQDEMIFYSAAANLRERGIPAVPAGQTGRRVHAVGPYWTLVARDMFMTPLYLTPDRIAMILYANFWNLDPNTLRWQAPQDMPPPNNGDDVIVQRSVWDDQSIQNRIFNDTQEYYSPSAARWLSLMNIINPGDLKKSHTFPKP